jgi:hypothetical protein
MMYPDKFKIKDDIESDKSASYLDILLDIDSNGRLTTTLYHKREDFDFAMVDFPFLYVTATEKMGPDEVSRHNGKSAIYNVTICT